MAEYKKKTKQERDEEYDKYVASLFIEGIKTQQAPWMKPWSPDMPKEYNPINDVYKGTNQLVLELYRTVILHSDDPRWLTFNQIRDINKKIKNEKKHLWVKKGAKGVPIRFYSPIYLDKDNNQLDPKDPNLSEKIAKKSSILKQYFVFNSKDIIRKIYNKNGEVKLDENGNEMYKQGLPPLEKKDNTIDFEPIITAENIIKNTNAKIYHDQKDRCFYTEYDDAIHMVKPQNFASTEDYYDTLLHELTHWTGETNRLNREEIQKYQESDQWRAREELIAEIGSYMLAREANINFKPTENNLAYVNSWVQFLSEKPSEINNACKKATEASKYILSFSNTNKNQPKEDIKENEIKETKGKRR